MNLSGKQIEFRQTRTSSNPYRVLLLFILIIVGLVVLRSFRNEEIVSPFLPTPLPTRTTNSYALEGQTHFMAGDLNKAITAYQSAIKLDPTNLDLYAELVRIQTYSTTLLTTDTEKFQRLQEAMAVINQALEVSTDDSGIWAAKSFVENWLSFSGLSGSESAAYSTNAEQSAVRALQLDNNNILALVYYAELLIGQQKWGQADQYIRQALEKDPSLMDVHRVYGYLQETYGNYGEAINAYKRAVEITPNFTYLHLSIGLNYRVLENYSMALEYFDKAATINSQLGILDPLPYLAIGKTYTRMGEFFVASRNVLKALQYNPYSPDVYGQLGIVYFKSRNYEGSLEALKCATLGCTAEESCSVRQCNAETDPAIAIEGMPVSSSSVVYWYTYGSALAGLHRPYNTYCQQALEIFDEVREEFGSDDTIMSIITPSEEICASFGITR